MTFVIKSRAGVGFGRSISSPNGSKDVYHWKACSYKNGILDVAFTLKLHEGSQAKGKYILFWCSQCKCSGLGQVELPSQLSERDLGVTCGVNISESTDGDGGQTVSVVGN